MKEHLSPRFSGGREILTSPLILVTGTDRRKLCASLSMHGHSVTDAPLRIEAISALCKNEPAPDLIVLDIKASQDDAFEMCGELCRLSGAKILVLLEDGGEREKVDILDAGADDCIAKPFGIQEVLARIRNPLRHSRSAIAEVPVVARDLQIDFAREKVTVRRKTFHLTRNEFALLRYLVANHGKTLSHEDLVNAMWGSNYRGGREHLRVLVNQLRKKIEHDPSHPQCLYTDRWFGYRFEFGR